MNILYKAGITACTIAVLLSSGGNAEAQENRQMTLDTAVDVAMKNSYRIKHLQMNIEANRLWLKSRQAGLKSRVYMNMKMPNLSSSSDFEWDSNENRDVIVRKDTSKWQMDLAVSQPVVIMGYPTNGYLSFNTTTYRYLQKNQGNDVDYYNRYYMKFQQPFFQPNYLKNNIEDAELDLQRRELEYVRDRAWTINSIADDYYDFFEYTCNDIVYQTQVDNLNRVEVLANQAALADTTRRIETVQAKVEIANIREDLLKNQSRMRQEGARLKQRLRMSLEDSIFVVPEFPFKSIIIDLEQAIEFGHNLSPTLRMLGIDRRKNQISVNNAEGWDSFNLNLEMTYGLEKQHDRYQSIWEEFDNSNSIALNAYIPVWDWGRKKTRLEAQKISLRRTELRIEENRTEISSNISIEVENFLELQGRTENMMESRTMAADITEAGVEQYRSGAISIRDVIQMIESQKDTEMNFLDAYQGYRRSLISLMMHTFYDYENGISLLDKFRPTDI